MKRKIFTTTLLICCFAVCLAAIADLTGKWSGVLKAPDGNEYPLTYVFKIDADKITGTLETPQGIVPLDNGKTNGTDFSFSVTVSGMEFPCSGKYYAAADSVGLNVDFNGVKTHSTLTRTP